MSKLGIIASHPIQYQAPWFRGLAKEVELEVFFAHRPNAAQQGEGFGKSFSWDVNLLSGYRHRFLKNVAARPSPSRFFGCNTPEIAEIISGKKNDDGRLKMEDGREAHLSPTFSPMRRGGDASNSQPSTLNSSARFDAFIVSGWHLNSYWQAIRACRRVGIPVLVRGDSQLLTPRSRLKTWIKEIAYRMMLRQFDGFLVVGQRNREYLAHYGVPSRQMFFAPHFVDNDWFAAKATEVRNRKSEIRKKWGIPEDAFCALFCGKFIPQKRPQDLVAAAQKLIAKNAKNSKDSSKHKVHLLFAGSGELGGQLREQCDIVFDAEKPNSQLSTPNPQLPSASFAGFLNQSELPAAYVVADVLVLPSESETWGLAVNEAMACGLPSIVSDAVGCAPDLIDESKTGFTFPVSNAAALAERLEQLAEMRRNNFDFSSTLSQKLVNYSVNNAVRGTLKAAEALVIT